MSYSDENRSYSEELTTPSDCDISDFDHMMFSDSNVKPSAFKNKQFFCEKKPGSRNSPLCMEAVAQVSLGKKVAEAERELRPDGYQNGLNGVYDMADGDKSHEPCFPWQQKSKWQKSSGMPPPPPAVPVVNGESNIPPPPPPPPMPQILSPPIQTNFKKSGFTLEGVKLRKTGVSNPHPPTRIDSLKHKFGMQQGRENLKPVALPGMSDLHKEEPIENGCNMKSKFHNGSATKMRFPLQSIETKEQQCWMNGQKSANLQTSPKPVTQNPLFKPRDLKRSAKKLNIYSPMSPKPGKMAPATLPKPPTPVMGNNNPPKLFKSESKPKMMLESPTQSLPQRWLQNLPKWNAQNREAQNSVQQGRTPPSEDVLPPPPLPAPVKYNFKVKTKKYKPKVSLGFTRVGQVWVQKVR